MERAKYSVFLTLLLFLLSGQTVAEDIVLLEKEGEADHQTNTYNMSLPSQIMSFSDDSEKTSFNFLRPANSWYSPLDIYMYKGNSTVRLNDDIHADSIIKKLGELMDNGCEQSESFYSNNITCSPLNHAVYLLQEVYPEGLDFQTAIKTRTGKELRYFSRETHVPGELFVLTLQQHQKGKSLLYPIRFVVIALGENMYVVLSNWFMSVLQKKSLVDFIRNMKYKNDHPGTLLMIESVNIFPLPVSWPDYILNCIARFYADQETSLLTKFITAGFAMVMPYGVFKCLNCNKRQSRHTDENSHGKNGGKSNGKSNDNEKYNGKSKTLKRRASKADHTDPVTNMFKKKTGPTVTAIFTGVDAMGEVLLFNLKKNNFQDQQESATREPPGEGIQATAVETSTTQAGSATSSAGERNRRAGPQGRDSNEAVSLTDQDITGYESKLYTARRQGNQALLAAACDLCDEIGAPAMRRIMRSNTNLINSFEKAVAEMEKGKVVLTDTQKVNLSKINKRR